MGQHDDEHRLAISHYHCTYGKFVSIFKTFVTYPDVHSLSGVGDPYQRGRATQLPPIKFQQMGMVQYDRVVSIIIIIPAASCIRKAGAVMETSGAEETF